MRHIDHGGSADPFAGRLFVSQGEAAHALSVSVRSIYAWRAEGRIKARKLGAKVLIEVASLRRLLDMGPAKEAA